ncbi:MAG: ATP-binding protein [Rhodospirillales bacterium]|nr:ATP-binding protein [Rhodospirillales bacterium]
MADIGKREAARIEERLIGLKNIAKTLAKNNLTINGLIDISGRKSYLPAFFRSLSLPASNDVTVSLVDYKGRVIATNQQRKGKETLRVVTEEAVDLNDDGLIISEPVIYSGSPEGAVIVHYRPTAYTKLFGTSSFGDDFFLVNREDKVIFSTNQNLAAEGSYRPKTDNANWIQVHNPLGLGGLSVTVGSSLEKALKPLETVRWILFVGLSLFLMTVVALIIVSALAVSRPLNRFASKIATIENMTDLGQPLDISGPREIAEVAQTFNNMLGKLKETTVSKEFIDNILGSISDGIITIDSSGLIRSFNAGAQQIFGYSEFEVVKKNVSILLPVEERVEHEFYTENSKLKAPRIINQSRDLIGRRKDGSLFPMDLVVTPLKIEGDKGFVGTLRDITERKEIDRLKSEFISTVSHELRTPLTSIKGSLGLVAGGAVGIIPEKAMKMVEVAYKNSDRLIGLVNDILDMEKLVSGKFEFHFEKLDIADLVAESIKINQGYADEYNVEFSSFDVIEDVNVWGDRDRLHQVLANILSNAAKFSPEGEIVKLSVGKIDDMIRISITDRGPGISEAFQERIFERFAQADASDTKQMGGTGLGLNISKSIVEKHGGTIGFETRIGEGTTFYFMIPHMQQDTDKMRRASDKVIGEPKRPLEEKKIEKTKSHLENSEWKISTLPKVLYLEDDPDIVNLVSSLLEDSCDVVVAETLAKARKMIQSERYELAILDIGLPDGSGLDLIDELKLNKNSSTPIVVFSAQEVGSSIAENIEAALVKSKTSNELLTDTVKSLVYFKALPDR